MITKQISVSFGKHLTENQHATHEVIATRNREVIENDDGYIAGFIAGFITVPNALNTISLRTLIRRVGRSYRMLNLVALHVSH